MTKLRHTPEGDYLPGIGRQWLMPLYDPMSRLLGVGRLHRLLLDGAGIGAGADVLEIGCGTGNLLTALVRGTPGVRAVGVDPDRAALGRARRKAPGVDYRHGFAAALPVADASVDVVLSSLMLHHLDGDGRDRALREVVRVLRPGGAVHVLDIEGHGMSRGLTPAVFTAAGLEGAAETGRGTFGRRYRYQLFSARASTNECLY